MAQKTVHYRPGPSTLAQMTVRFGSRPSTFGQTVHFRATVHFKDRPLLPFWTRLLFTNIDVTLLLDRCNPSFHPLWPSIFLFRPSIFSLNRPLSVFWTVHIETFCPSTSSLFDRRLLSLMTVQCSYFRPSSFILSGRQFFDVKIVHFRGPSTFSRLNRPV